MTHTVIARADDAQAALYDAQSAIDTALSNWGYGLLKTFNNSDPDGYARTTMSRAMDDLNNALDRLIAAKVAIIMGDAQ